MKHIDGSMGEGGGQVLRSSLSLALLTGQEIRIENIRAGRRSPGLRPQHLKSVEAAAEVGSARLEGAAMGATALCFAPRGIRSGDYAIDIATAGAVSLVFQTLLLPLCRAEEPSRLLLRGGTHVLWSPCFHYLERQFLPFLERLGVRAKLSLHRAGFYPKGGGEMEARIEPGGPLRPLELTEPGPLQAVEGLSAVGGLPGDIARRQARRARQALEPLGVPVDIEEAELPAFGKGTLLLLKARFEHGSACHFALGARGKPAERVADEAAAQLAVTLASGAAMDEHLADQLLLPLALCPGTSHFSTPKVTGHLLTNARLIPSLLPVRIDIEGKEGGFGRVRIEGASR